MKLRNYIPPMSIVLFIALTLAGTYYVRLRVLRTALGHAVEVKDEKTIESMIRSWPCPLDAKSRRATALLAWAAETGNEGLARACLEAGVNPNCTNPIGWPALPDKKDLFEDEERDRKYETETEYFGATFYIDSPPLAIAAAEGHMSIVLLCLEFGADPSGRITLPEGPVLCDGVHGSAIHYTIAREDLETVKLLVEKGADVNAGGAVMEWVLWKENPAGLTFQDYVSGVTPMHLAWMKHGREIAELLISKGAQVNVHDGYGFTPLHGAVEESGSKRFPETGVAKLEFLLAHGADVNAVEQNGWTPLHLASWQGLSPAAAALLKHGADANAKTKDGETPLSLARKGQAFVREHPDKSQGARPEQWDEVIRLLVEAGAAQ